MNNSAATHNRVPSLNHLRIGGDPQQRLPSFGSKLVETAKARASSASHHNTQLKLNGIEGNVVGSSAIPQGAHFVVNTQSD